MNHKKAIVIGAGITGLATAWGLEKEGYEVTILEKTDRIGGLAGTLDWDGWKFDYGAHGFHSKHQDIIHFFKNKLSGNFLPRKVNAKLVMFNKLMKYPIVGAQVFTSLGEWEMLIAGLDFLVTRIKAFLFGIKSTEHLDEWIIGRFGKTLYKTYFGPYIQRIQKKDVHLLSSDIGTKKIPIFSIRQYLLRELIKNKWMHPDEKILFHTYYIKSGFGELCNYFFNDLKQSDKLTIALGQTIKRIRVKGHQIVEIETDQNKYKTEDTLVISTIPLENLFQVIDCSDELKQTSKKLEYTSARFLLLKTKLNTVSGATWTNFNGDEYSFNRVSEHVYNEFEMVPKQGCSSLTFEFPLNKDERYWSLSDKELVKEILPHFNKVYHLKIEDILDIRSEWVEYATPRMTIGYQEVLNTLFSYIITINNLYCIGRQGVFSYMNADQCIRFAFDFCDTLKNKKTKKWQSNIIKKLHNIDLISQHT